MRFMDNAHDDYHLDFVDLHNTCDKKFKRSLLKTMKSLKRSLTQTSVGRDSVLTGLALSDVDGTPVANGNRPRAFRYVGQRRAWEELQSSSLLGSSVQSHEQLLSLPKMSVPFFIYCPH